MSKVLLLINPLSGEGKCVQVWKRYTKNIPQNFITIDVTQVKNLSSLLRQKKPNIVGIIGGDGTINTVCQSVLSLPKKYRPHLAVIPCGFGNALSYCLGTETIPKALDVLKHPKKKLAIDVLTTNLSYKPFGISNISVGFDARVVYSRMNDRYIGFRSYILSAIKSLFTHPQHFLKITVDNSFTFSAVASSLVIANSPVIGQEFVIAPHARLNDGLLDCTLFSTKYAYLTNLRFKGFKHPLYSRGGKVFFKAKELLITGDPFVQVDGDSYMRQEEIRIAIIPQALTFLHNSLDTTFLAYQSFIS